MSQATENAGESVLDRQVREKFSSRSRVKLVVTEI